MSPAGKIIITVLYCTKGANRVLSLYFKVSKASTQASRGGGRLKLEERMSLSLARD